MQVSTFSSFHLLISFHSGSFKRCLIHLSARKASECFSFSEASPGSSPIFSFAIANSFFNSFVGLSGTYFSLQYLSLSDVTVLAFLVPMCTALSGSFFLKEIFTRREALAGCKIQINCSKGYTCLSSQSSVQSVRCCAHRTARLFVWGSKGFVSGRGRA